MTKIAWQYDVALAGRVNDPTYGLEMQTVGDIISLPSATEAMQHGVNACGRAYGSIQGTEDRVCNAESVIVTGFTVSRWNPVIMETDDTWSLNGGLTDP